MQQKVSKPAISSKSMHPEYKVIPGKKAFWAGVMIITVVAVAVIVWVVSGLIFRETEFARNLQKRFELISSSQVQLTENVLQTVISQADRVVNSELFKLYATEVHLIADDVSLLVSGPLPGQSTANKGVTPLATQLPVMESLLLEFTRISGYLEGKIVNRAGTVYIATDATSIPLRADQMVWVNQVLQRHEPRFGPLQSTSKGLVLEAYLPIFPSKESGLDRLPVAVLLLTKLVGERIDEMHASNLLEQGERIRLVQKVANGYQEVVSWRPGQLQHLNTPLAVEDNNFLPFMVRMSLSGDTRVYSLGRPIAGPDWWVIVEADYDLTREPLRAQMKSRMSVAVLLVLICGVAFSAIWALLVSHQERKIARHFKRLSEEIEKQRQLLDRINNTISDYIILKDPGGHYLYVNPAFADAVGKEAQELIGLDDRAVFGDDAAHRLAHSDQQVSTSGEPATLNETLYLQSQLHHLQISKAALKDADGTPSGVVSVIRDVTGMIKAQKRHEQAMAKTVEALVKAIELTDPYLAGHSRMIGRIGVVVAKALNASDLEIATIETAANLSQIGKLFVNRELLFKTEILTPEEKAEMESHVGHAAKVLEGIDFGLPVLTAVCQMNETLDGRGYPEGVQAPQIGLPARILGVVNSFCAMVKPRAYRKARSVDEALSIIEDEAGSYDERVVAVLKQVVKSASGEKLLAKYCCD